MESPFGDPEDRLPEIEERLTETKKRTPSEKQQTLAVRDIGWLVAALKAERAKNAERAKKAPTKFVDYEGTSPRARACGHAGQED
jgi:hypothetical protein